MKNKEEKRFTLTKEEMNVNLKKLQEDVKKAYGTMRELLPEAIKNKEIKPFGNASHIILPKEYANKKATIIINK
jgi:putative transposon-encoded protein